MKDAKVDMQNQAEYAVAVWIRGVASRTAYVGYKALMGKQGFNPLNAEHFDPRDSASDNPFLRLQELGRRVFSVGSRWIGPNGRILIAKAVTPQVMVSFSEEGDTKIISHSPLSQFFKSLRRG